MEKHILESKVAQLQEESRALEIQINEIEDKKTRIDREIAEYNEQLQRIQFKGMTRNEYFRAIAGKEFEEDGYKIKIGSPYTTSITISRYDEEEDFEFTVNGSFNSEGGTLDILRRGDYQKGTKWYQKKYIGKGEVPKKRMAMYLDMIDLKSKYGDMMENAEIEV